jgi:hypothetical protein
MFEYERIQISARHEPEQGNQSNCASRCGQGSRQSYASADKATYQQNRPDGEYSHDKALLPG